MCLITQTISRHLLWVWQFDRVGQIHDQSAGEDLVRESRGRCAGINWFRISVDEELQLRLRQQFLSVLEIFTINRYFDKDMVDGYYFVLLEVVECESHHHEHSDEKKWQSHQHRFTNFAGVCHIKYFKLLNNIWISVLLRPTEGLGVGEDGEGEAAPHCSRQVGADTLVSPRVVGEHRPRAALYTEIRILRIWVLWILILSPWMPGKKV